MMLEVLYEDLRGGFLVSAYDLHHRLLVAADALHQGSWIESELSRTDILIVDSGGYEVTLGADVGELVEDWSPTSEWTAELHERLLDLIPQEADNCAVVAFDRPGQPYEAQLRLAHESLDRRSNVASVVLLKPPDGMSHDFTQLVPLARELAGFAMLGVTHTELGRTIVDRVRGINTLRKTLSRIDLDLPIHVFGALDPLFVPLYFNAGADVFDGLAWLRYSYWHGLDVHRDQGALLDGLVEQDDEVRRAITAGKNLAFLADLRIKLMRFHAEDGDWGLFDDMMIGRDGERTGDVLRTVAQTASTERV